MKYSIALALLVVLGCSDTTAPLSVPARPPETEGEITERSHVQGILRILVSTAPSSPACPMPGPVTAFYYDVPNGTTILMRTTGANFRAFPADSLVVGRAVRAWFDGTPPPEGQCPPIFTAQAIEVLP
jgi:hypothetical protein